MSTVTLPNALLLNSWEIWSLLLCAYPLSVFTHPYLHQSWKAKSRRTEPRFDDCKSSLELTGEAQWSVANQGTQEHEDPTLEETRGPAQFLSLTEGVSFMRMNIWSSFLFRNRTFSQLFFFFCFIILEECFQSVTQCQRKQSNVFHQSAGHLMEFNGTIYLSKLTGITLSRTGASRKVHAPQLQRYMRTGREFWLLYCYYFRGAWRIDLINVSKLASSPIKRYLNSQGWSPAVILQTCSEVRLDCVLFLAGLCPLQDVQAQQGRGGHIWTFICKRLSSAADPYASCIKMAIFQLAQRVEVWVCMCWETWEHHMMKIQVTPRGLEAGQWRSLDESSVCLFCTCSSRVSC